MQPFVDEALPALEPFLGREATEYGWRAITSDGTIVEVRGQNGHRAEIPDDVVVTQGGKAVGRRKVRDIRIDIAEYLARFNRGGELHRANRFEEALAEYEAALALAPTSRARINRAFVLLAMGRWAEGLAEYERMERAPPFMRPQARAALDAGLVPWRGENLDGARIAVIHAHGFGDTIMTLRYVSWLANQDADVTLVLPPELVRLVRDHFHPHTLITISEMLPDEGFFTPALHLPYWCGVRSPGDIRGKPYLTVDAALVEKWRGIVGDITGDINARRIGIAWSVNKVTPGDYPRAVAIERMVAMLGGEGTLFSVQAQGAREAGMHGVHAFAFEDFADCAAFMMTMDEIVTVDTAAVHLAGAIGHPKVTLLVGEWASWRWLARWYDNVEVSLFV